LRRPVKVSGLEAKDFQARAEKLIRLQKSLDVFAAQVAHCARNGLSRIDQFQSGVGIWPACRADALLVRQTTHCGGECGKAGFFLAAFAPP